MHVGALYNFKQAMHKKYAIEQHIVEMLLFSEALVKKIRNNTMNMQTRAIAYLV